ncbi:hypothetical protein VSDG_00734 [Cytospora chrysosperma]|uniref:Myb-like DNA-binding domain-containing protein n=1 Tax=Cytospora chrysosperma TaxID=252740 RepID=A0A423WM76_CYTCH|nr:hypothetical protein VSDG_00734 [Valsa sordida]
MSSNNDNTMARFLFAILQQKNLKDIDWNAVAHNPVLAQGITNGHAARMRYSRFRASLLGIEPQRRNRTAANKSKVTKSKKETKTKTKKEKEKDEEEQPIKPDPSAAPDHHQENFKALSPKIKDEAGVKKEPQQQQQQTHHPDAPTEMPPAPITEAQLHFHHSRLLTPCSDTDIFAASHGYASSPVSEMLHSHNHEPSPFDYAGAAHCHVAPDQVASSWQPSPSYSPFQLQPYDMDGFGAAPFCDHQHAVTHTEGFGIAPSAMMGPDHTHVPVKQEEWDTRFC